MISADPSRPADRYAARRRRGELSRRHTRHRIVTAASSLFLDRGYAATTVEMIARAAGVAVPTLYLAVGGKREILLAVRDAALAGDEEPVALLEQSWVRQLAAETDLAAQLRLLCTRMVEINSRVTPVLRVMQQAAAVDPQVAADLAEDARRRYTTQKGWLAQLPVDRLRPGLTVAAATDLIWSLASPEMYHLLVGQRRWSRGRLAGWLADTLGQLLFAGAGPTTAVPAGSGPARSG